MNYRQFFSVIKSLQNKMPKCLNDTTKTYKGDEPSPKGLGYAAGNETVGHKMRGKDGNMWIVQETKTCKKWAKCKDEPESEPITIDFDNLPPTCYHKVYFPTTVKLETAKENGREDKFGGDVPFFIKGESWPMWEGVPQTFFCQLRDPRKDDNVLYRIFISVDNDYECANYHITKIRLNEENLKKQIIISKPSYDGKDIDVEKLTKFPAHKITKWTIEDEMKHFDSILEILKINPDDSSLDYDTLRDNWSDKNNGFGGIKVGGTPDFTQYADEKMYKKYNFLQITETNILPYAWGDCGIAHITDDGELYWDCC